MRIEDLERELRAERPELDPEFARKLDDWAAAGFPRGGELDRRVRGRAGSGFLGLGAIGRAFRNGWGRLTAVPPRRILAPVGAAATLIVIGTVAISQVPRGGDDDSADVESTAVSESATSGDADTGGDAPAAAPSDSALATPPSASDTRLDDYQSAAPEAAADAAEAASPIIREGRDENISRGTNDRLQDASARIRLGAAADEVQGVANGVVSVADRHNGFVLDSQVTTDQGGARASFALEIPFTELDAALTDLSELGDVISRTEAAEDITNRAVRAQKELADVRDQIADKRIELIEADSHEERLIIKSQIDSLEAQADTYEAKLNSVEREARFASVSVEVTSDGPDSDDGWGISDAVDDAGGVLETIGGIALISLAVLVPIGLVAALSYWLITLARNASRERALDAKG